MFMCTYLSGYDAIFIVEYVEESVEYAEEEVHPCFPPQHHRSEPPKKIRVHSVMMMLRVSRFELFSSLV